MVKHSSPHRVEEKVGTASPNMLDESRDDIGLYLEVILELNAQRGPRVRRDKEALDVDTPQGRGISRVARPRKKTANSFSERSDSARLGIARLMKKNLSHASVGPKSSP